MLIYNPLKVLGTSFRNDLAYSFRSTEHAEIVNKFKKRSCFCQKTSWVTQCTTILNTRMPLCTANYKHI